MPFFASRDACLREAAFHFRSLSPPTTHNHPRNPAHSLSICGTNKCTHCEREWERERRKWAACISQSARRRETQAESRISTVGEDQLRSAGCPQTSPCTRSGCQRGTWTRRQRERDKWLRTHFNSLPSTTELYEREINARHQGKVKSQWATRTRLRFSQLCLFGQLQTCGGKILSKNSKMV